jgi:hypothetical protein
VRGRLFRVETVAVYGSDGYNDQAMLLLQVASQPVPCMLALSIGCIERFALFGVSAGRQPCVHLRHVLSTVPVA